MAKANKTATAVLALLLMTSVAMGQKTLTLNDLIPGGTTYSQMMPEGLATAWWGERLMKPETDRLSEYQNGEWEERLTLAEVNAMLESRGLETLSTLKGAAFPSESEPLVRVATTGNRYLIDFGKKEIVSATPRPEGAVVEDLAAGTQPALAYVKDNNLYVQTPGGQTLQVTSDGSRDIVYGQAVHRDEFGITKGTFWSPDGTQLAFYRMDQSMVPDYPLVDITTPIATLAPTKYPMAGTESHRVTIGVFNLETQQTTWLQLGDPTDTYFTGITWSPDSKAILVYRLDREQKHLELLQADALTGELLDVLYEERSDKYVHPMHGVTFLPWDGDRLLYWSESNGWDNLYVYSLKEHATLGCLTENLQGVVVALAGFDTQKKAAIVASTNLSPLQQNIYSVVLKDHSIQLLDNGQGVHRPALSPKGTRLVDSWTSGEVKRQYDLVDTKSAKTEVLLQPKDPWEGYSVPQITTGSLKAADDSTDLYYRLILPLDFDETKQYPTIVYLYGGPGTRMVDASWGANYRGWELYMASLGYVVFVMDNRGSSLRGRDFEQTTYLRLGQEEVKDQMRGVDFLRSLPYVDSSRLGIHGWSFGGFMTINMMLSNPGVFKAGVAGGPVIDWKYYEVMYGERYMSTPQKNPEGYEAADLKARVDSLQGRLLVIFGYNDPVCVPQHSLSFIRAAIDAGKPIDMFTYPGSEHNMAGRERVHLHEKITQYFVDNLR